MVDFGIYGLSALRARGLGGIALADIPFLTSRLGRAVACDDFATMTPLCSLLFRGRVGGSPGRGKDGALRDALRCPLYSRDYVRPAEIRAPGATIRCKSTCISAGIGVFSLRPSRELRIATRQATSAYGLDSDYAFKYGLTASSCLASVYAAVLYSLSGRCSNASTVQRRSLLLIA